VQCILFRITRTKFAHTDETVKLPTRLCANCCSYNKKNIGFLLFSFIHDASFGSEQVRWIWIHPSVLYY